MQRKRKVVARKDRYTVIGPHNGSIALLLLFSGKSCEEKERFLQIWSLDILYKTDCLYKHVKQIIYGIILLIEIIFTA